MSQIRMQNHLTSSRSDVNYQMEPSVQTEIKTVSLNIINGHLVKLEVFLRLS